MAPMALRSRSCHCLGGGISGANGLKRKLFRVCSLPYHVGEIFGFFFWRDEGSLVALPAPWWVGLADLRTVCFILFKLFFNRLSERVVAAWTLIAAVFPEDQGSRRLRKAIKR